MPLKGSFFLQPLEQPLEQPPLKANIAAQFPLLRVCFFVAVVRVVVS